MIAATISCKNGSLERNITTHALRAEQEAANSEGPHAVARLGSNGQPTLVNNTTNTKVACSAAARASARNRLAAQLHISPTPSNVVPR